MSTEFKKAQSLLAFWLGCIQGERELLNEPALTDDTPILHFAGSGASAIVTYGQLRTLATYDPEEG